MTYIVVDHKDVLHYIKGDAPVIGHTLPCPNCESKKTAYSALHGWVCYDCGLFGIDDWYWRN